MKKQGAQPIASSNLLSTKNTKFSAKQYERPGLSEDEIV